MRLSLFSTTSLEIITTRFINPKDSIPVLLSSLASKFSQRGQCVISNGSRDASHKGYVTEGN